MSYHIFDLLYVDPDQVKEFLTAMAKEGLVGGVYLWINRVHGKMYVGSSINLHARLSYYFALKNVHGIIGQGLLKYGLDSFVLVIFFVPNATSSLVLALEQSVLDTGICAYNILSTAGSSVGFKHTDEAKEKMKGREHTDETKSRISATKKGHSTSEETKSKISATKKGQKHSGETKAKMSSSHLGEKNPRFNKGKPVYLYVVHPHGVELQAVHFNTLRLAESLGVPKFTLYKRIKNRTLFQIKGVSYIVSRDGNLLKIALQSFEFN